MAYNALKEAKSAVKKETCQECYGNPDTSLVLEMTILEMKKV